jgi:phage terminase small subunit
LVEEEMTERRGRGRPKKDKPKLTNVPIQFEANPELDLTEMQAAFVWHYTEGLCGQTEAARRAGFAFPAAAASKMLDGKTQVHVTRAIRLKQDELREKYAITPEKTGTMLWNIAETAFEGGAYNAAVSAVKELNQLAGLTVHRSQNLNINANVDRMNKDDIKARLEELLGVRDTLDPKDL